MTFAGGLSGQHAPMYAVEYRVAWNLTTSYHLMPHELMLDDSHMWCPGKVGVERREVSNTE